MLLFLLGFTSITAQKNSVAVLKKLLLTANTDTIKANILSQLCGEANEGEWQVYNKQLQILVNANLANCKTPILCNFYKIKQGNVFANTGYDLMNKGILANAIEFDLKALKIYEEYNCITELGETQSNIGYLYQQQKDFNRAEKYYSLALNNFKLSKFEEGIATSYNNLGYVSKVQGKYVNAKIYYTKSIEIAAKINDLEGLAGSTNNLGLVYRKLNDDNNALACYKKSINLFEQIDDKEGLLFALNNISNVYKKQGNYKDAIEFSDKAFEIGKTAGSIDGMLSITNTKYDIYKSQKMFEQALYMHEEYIKYRDSLNNKDNRVAILEQQFKYDQDKQTLKHEKKQAIDDAEKQQHKLLTYVIALILLIVLGFSFWLFKKFKQTSKQKTIIEKQKLEVEFQKQLVDEHQKEIQDSINYAKRIQTSFLASNTEFENNFNDYFIYFNPKDVVSGDFYWANTINHATYLCVADSTGHGIPGAFMSLLNISLLNEAVLSKNLNTTSDILNFVRKILILGLKPDESGQGGNDGMDCALIKVDNLTLEMQFSGANNPIWILRDNEIIELLANKMPVGRSPNQTNSFTVNNFQLLKQDIVYLFTDGYADQFGGEKMNLKNTFGLGKKFKYKQLKELLLSINQQPLSQQSLILNSTFVNWKGNLEQVDDVCIVGIKI